MAFVDANAASASVVNVTALRKLDVPCEFCKPLLSRLRLAQLFKLCSSAFVWPAVVLSALLRAHRENAKGHLNRG